MKGRAEAAAIIMLVIITVTIVIPAFFLTIALVQQATTLFEHIQDADTDAILASLRIQENLDRLEEMIPGFDSSPIQPQPGPTRRCR